MVGLDVAEEMLDVARRKAAALGLTNVTFRPADVTTLPFDAGSFDAVISRFCLMFLPDAPKAVAEIARVLTPGGYVAAAVGIKRAVESYRRGTGLALPMAIRVVTARKPIRSLTG